GERAAVQRCATMTMPFYVAPEQVMKDRAEYATKGIARGRSLVATVFSSGVLIVAENPSRTLHKISEIYDRVAFAGAGRYNEFDQLRVAGVRHADTKGYAYSREDVDARSLANLYAQYLGQVFTHEMKPLEVEILVAELDPDGRAHQLYHIAYDGTVVDEEDYTVLGGDADAILARMASTYRPGWELPEALVGSVRALGGPERTLSAGDLEVAVLELGRDRRAFRRVENTDLDSLLAGPGAGGRPPGGSGAEAASRPRRRAPASSQKPADGGSQSPSRSGPPPAVPEADGQ
ncbi:MAG: proteasome subunit alpha, partial [Acidimicrobiales bacterium]